MSYRMKSEIEGQTGIRQMRYGMVRRNTEYVLQVATLGVVLKLALV